ncbi:hypothetical protein E2C01_072813 [Portunus trituberculatus]|uniref:Uncharacterized protein n=1 Tax=Portunus trituberculatus TaxID=210409 RepID=A0A5B7I8W7_PORTR|nr:hypothetical protein [Portunus trituberculatus]
MSENSLLAEGITEGVLLLNSDARLTLVMQTVAISVPFSRILCRYIGLMVLLRPLSQRQGITQMVDTGSADCMVLVCHD